MKHRSIYITYPFNAMNTYKTFGSIIRRCSQRTASTILLAVSTGSNIGNINGNL